MVEKRRLFCSVMSPYPVELPVLCFLLPLWFLPPVYYISDVFYSTQTVKFLPCPTCVQLCLSLNSCYRKNRVRCGTARQIWQTEKTTTTLFPKIPCSKIFLAAGKRDTHHVSLYFSVFLRIDLLLLLGYHYCWCCCSVAVVIKNKQSLTGK